MSQSSGLQHHVVTWQVIDILVDHTASV